MPTPRSAVPVRPLLPVATVAFRDALDGADAFRAVRNAVRLDRGTLRLGNRFVPLDRYREIAFVALGNASSSFALALWESLGERLTQGIIAGPTAPPENIPFRSWKLPGALPGSPEGITVARSVEELVSGLGAKDLLILLVSPGALAALSQPPPGVTGSAWSAFLESLLRAGASGREVETLVRVFGGGLVGGRLARRTNAGEVETLLLDRGSGGELVGGGPTVPLLADEVATARRLLEAHRTLPELPAYVAELVRQPLPGPAADRPGLHRPVVMLGPGDALRGASDAFADRRYTCRLAEVTIDDPPEAAAARLLRRAEEILADLRWDPRAGASESARENDPGVAIFAGLTLGLPEGVPESDAVDRFLRAGHRLLQRRGSALVVLPTAGSTRPGGAGAGGLLEADAPIGAMELRTLPMGAGITDVGVVAAAVYRSGA